ncbi:hypothetical protein L218DRAFT_956044, partial [Marasmius fiardii PR-910]
MLLSTLIVAAATLLSPAVSASPATRETNGQRMARGLPPLPPRSFGQDIPGIQRAAISQEKPPKPSPSGSFVR